MQCDVAILGGGIIGTAIARELSQYRLRVTLFEKAADIAFGGSTKANTGIIHAGYDDAPGTLKARLCVQGNDLWPTLARDLAVPFTRIGSLVVAVREAAVPALRELKARGAWNGVPHLELVDDHERLMALEAQVTRQAVAGLYAPTAGITSPYEMAVALAENARANGARILVNTTVTKVRVTADTVTGLHTSAGPVAADYVINAAGLASQALSAQVGIDDVKLTPVKGEYYVFDKRLNGLVNHVLFPVPTPISKGIVVTPTVSGNLLIGPNAHPIDDDTDLATTTPGLAEVLHGATALLPALTALRGMIITAFAGLRTESRSGDFTIKAYDAPRGFINVAGIKSPGLTAAPAIAKLVTRLLDEAGLPLTRKTTFKPHRTAIPRTIDAMAQKRLRPLLTADPRYGHMVCRCEHVSEGEIVEAIKRGASTLDGVKFRTRAGMGRCQGGFCTPRILRLLSRELGVPMETITTRGGRSHVLLSPAKALLTPEGS